TSTILVNCTKSVQSHSESEPMSSSGPTDTDGNGNGLDDSHRDNNGNSHGDNGTSDSSSPPGSSKGSDNSDNDNNGNGSHDDQDDDDNDDDDRDFLSITYINDQDSAKDDDESSEESNNLYSNDLHYEELLDKLNKLVDDADKNHSNDKGKDNENKDNEDSNLPDDPLPADAEIPDNILSNLATVSQLVLYLNWLVDLCSFFVSLTSFDATGAALKHAFSTLLADLHRMTNLLHGSAMSINIQDVHPCLLPVTSNGTIVLALPHPTLVLKALNLEDLPIFTVKQDQPVPEQQFPFVIREDQGNTVNFEWVKSVLLCIAGWIVVFKILLGLHEAGQVIRLHAPMMDLNSVTLLRSCFWMTTTKTSIWLNEYHSQITKTMSLIRLFWPCSQMIAMKILIWLLRFNNQMTTTMTLT
ncbi:hypothetical protein H0H87_002325, partial [Tephrocybe sp. NHM501043]